MPLSVKQQTEKRLLKNITLDITMPRLDGVGALAQIMEYDNDAKALMITAAGQKQKVVEALKLGAKAFIMKPFDKEDVLKQAKNCNYDSVVAFKEILKRSKAKGII